MVDDVRQPDPRKNRTRLFWHGEFSRLMHDTFPDRHFRYESGTPQQIEPAELRLLKISRNTFEVELIDPVQIAIDSIPSDEPTPSPLRKEGAVKYSEFRTYERDPKIRTEAIRLHGLRCQACGFDFGEMYGAYGEGFIEIHHLHPLFEIGESHEVNPLTDLVPICSNCHRMIHRWKDRMLSVEELRTMVSVSKAGNSIKKE